MPSTDTITANTTNPTSTTSNPTITPTFTNPNHNSNSPYFLTPNIFITLNTPINTTLTTHLTATPIPSTHS
ncbi:hypothetical protein, partial [Kocuria rhizophila]|uniref:hypothetical protein n=1 Tax=Kocuria rhizophila TaxID=72000 RepID=UPI001C931480